MEHVIIYHAHKYVQFEWMFATRKRALYLLQNFVRATPEAQAAMVAQVVFF